MLRPWLEPAALPAAAAPFAPLPDDELETAPLPRDHPRWVKDAVAISLRARRIFAGLRSPAIRVFSFWDHGTRAATIAGRALGIDSSGSYYAVQ